MTAEQKKEFAALLRRAAALLDAPVAPAVDAGPVPLCDGEPDDNILRYRAGKTTLFGAFLRENTTQGDDYWRQYADLPYSELPPEPKAIIDAWCAELEKMDA